MKRTKLLLIFIFLLLSTLSSAVTLNDLRLEIFPILCSLACFLIYIVSAIASLIILINGIRYITSAENPYARSEAKKNTGYAIIGLLIVILAPMAVKYIVESLDLIIIECDCAL